VRVDAQSTVPLELDGEPVGILPIEAEVVPLALRVICRRRVRMSADTAQILGRPILAAAAF